MNEVIHCYYRLILFASGITLADSDYMAKAAEKKLAGVRQE
jgi:hypothetical protein